MVPLMRAPSRNAGSGRSFRLREAVGSNDLSKKEDPMVEVLYGFLGGQTSKYLEQAAIDRRRACMEEKD